MSQKEPNIEQEVIDTIMKVWKKYPSLRLTQLIVNAIEVKNPCPDVFYVEDSDLINLLNNFNP